MERLLNVNEAAAMTGVSVFTMRRWARLQRVAVVKLTGRSLRFRTSDLEALVKKSLQPARESER